MVNKPKRQGTKNEVRVGDWFATFSKQVIRLAEGGTTDAGDLAIEDVNADWWIIECRDRERMNAHKVLAKAKAKAARAAEAGKVPYPIGVILQWKRITLKEGNVQRSAEGEPELFIMDGETLKRLLSVKLP